MGQGEQTENAVDILYQSDKDGAWKERIAALPLPAGLLKLVREIHCEDGWRDECWARIFELLEGAGKCGFVAPWELHTLWFRVPDLMDGLDLTDDEYDGVIAAIFAHPLRVHEFEVDIDGVHRTITSPTDLWIPNLLIGGPKELTLRQKVPHSRANVLSGGVLAATLEGAIRRVEETLDEVLGALRAVGLCEFANAWLGPESTLATVTMKDSWRSNGQPFALTPAYSYRLRGMRAHLPADLTEPEKRLLTPESAGEAIGRHIRQLKKVLAGSDERARELRGACRLAVNAEDSGDFGIMISLAFSCLEGLLLQRTTKEDVLGRLSEAVAFSLARSAVERDALRKEVKRLYEVRSIFVHTGRLEERARAREQALDLMYRVLRREIDLLPGV